MPIGHRIIIVPFERLELAPNFNDILRVVREHYGESLKSLLHPKSPFTEIHTHVFFVEQNGHFEWGECIHERNTVQTFPYPFKASLRTREILDFLRTLPTSTPETAIDKIHNLCRMGRLCDLNVLINEMTQALLLAWLSRQSISGHVFNANFNFTPLLAGNKIYLNDEPIPVYQGFHGNLEPRNSAAYPPLEFQYFYNPPNKTGHLLYTHALLNYLDVFGDSKSFPPPPLTSRCLERVANPEIRGKIHHLKDPMSIRYSPVCEWIIRFLSVHERFHLAETIKVILDNAACRANTLIKRLPVVIPPDSLVYMLYRRITETHIRIGDLRGGIIFYIGDTGLYKIVAGLWRGSHLLTADVASQQCPFCELPLHHNVKDPTTDKLIPNEERLGSWINFMTPKIQIIQQYIKELLDAEPAK